MASSWDRLIHLRSGKGGRLSFMLDYIYKRVSFSLAVELSDDDDDHVIVGSLRELTK